MSSRTPPSLAQPKGIGSSSAPVVIVAQNGDQIPRWSGLDLKKTDDPITVEQEGNR